MSSKFKSKLFLSQMKLCVLHDSSSHFKDFSIILGFVNSISYIHSYINIMNNIYKIGIEHSGLFEKIWFLLFFLL